MTGAIFSLFHLFHYSLRSSLIVTISFLCLLLAEKQAGGETQHADPFDLATCVEMALQNNPETILSQLELEVATSTYDLEKSRNKPLLDLNANLGHINGQIIGANGVVINTDTLDPSKNKSYANTALILSVPLFSDGTILGFPTQMEQSFLHSADAAVWNKQAVQLQTQFTVTEIYFNVLKSLTAIEIYTTIHKFAEVVFEEAESKYEQDLISRSEFLQAQADLEKHRTSKTNAVLAHEQYIKYLSLLMGAGDHKIEIKDYNSVDLELPPYDDISEQAIKNSPLVKTQIAKLKSSDAEAEHYRNKSLPSVDFVAKYGYGTDLDQENDGSFQANLQLVYNIVDFGFTSQEQSLAEKKREVERQKLLSLKGLIKIDIVNRYYELLQMENKLVYYDAEITHANEDIALKKEKQEQNLLPVTDVNTAEISLQNLILEKKQVFYDIMSATYQLHWLLK
jgi:outer membrane protein TolC